MSKKQFTFLLENDLHSKLKLLCVEQGITMAQVLEDLVIEYIAQNK